MLAGDVDKILIWNVYTYDLESYCKDHMDKQNY